MSYDQWKTASPYDDDPDLIQEAEKLLREYEKAKLNWEESPGPWKYYLDKMENMIRNMMDVI